MQFTTGTNRNELLPICTDWYSTVAVDQRQIDRHQDSQNKSTKKQQPIVKKLNVH